MIDKENIEKKINEAILVLRPYLQEDGGDLDFVRYEEDTGVLEVRLLGACDGCPMSIMTLRAGIERYIIKNIPEVKRVEAVK